MQRHRKLLVSAALLTPLFVVGTVAALETSTTTTTKSSTQSSAETTTLSTEEKQALTQRLTQRKDALKTKLAAAEQQRIQTKCKNAQGVIAPLANGIETAHTKREEVYGGVIARLATLVGKLKAQNVDTTKLQSEIDALKTQYTQYQTDMTAYKQAVTDLKSMDCVSDPAGFKASLDAARTALAKVQTDAAGIKTYVKETVKPTLQSLRTQLESSGGNQ